MPIDRESWRNHFWTAQLITGGYASATMLGIGPKDGWGIMFGSAMLAFIAVMPLSAAGAALYVWYRSRFPEKPGPHKTRWIKVPLVTLLACLLFFGTLVLLKD